MTGPFPAGCPRHTHTLCNIEDTQKDSASTDDVMEDKIFQEASGGVATDMGGVTIDKGVFVGLTLKN